MDKELAIIEAEPVDVITRGRSAATELTKIVTSRKKKLVMAGKEYLFFEDWQTIGKFYGVSPKVTNTEELREEGKLVGFLATAVAVASGNEVSGADAECTYDEPNWNGKPRFQLRSMAQTRACAKALRNCLGWVAVLAGYEATPAEEMAGVLAEPDKSQHWCPEHDTAFFKKGKMRQFAHPIGDTGEWCNEGEQSEPSIAAPEPSPAITQPELTLDMSDVLMENLTKLNWKDSTAISYLTSTYKVEKGDVLTCIAQLEPEQLADFCTHIQETVNKRGVQGT